MPGEGAAPGWLGHEARAVTPGRCAVWRARLGLRPCATERRCVVVVLAGAVSALVALRLRFAGRFGSVVDTLWKWQS